MEKKNIYIINSLSHVCLSVCDTTFCCIIVSSKKANVVSVCLFITDICGLRPGQWDERALRTSVRSFVRSSSFLSFFLSFCLSVCPSVSPSVHPSFFPSLTSPSSLAPFSVSLIYMFLVSFSGNHVIGLLSMCSNVHTTAYMQLLDFLPILHLKYMISNFNLFEGFFMENKWSQIGHTLWFFLIYKTPDFYDKFY
jgi:hypothetical protein